jgi:hypothetical protein
MPVPKKVAERIAAHLKQYQAVLELQKSRDVSEADTVTVVKDLLSDVFGYDKYAELTSEHSIRATFCDLAVKLDGKLAFLIEVKAIGVELKDGHVRQAIDYAANQGCEWVVLTNAIEWRLYHVIFKKPIDKKEIAHFLVPGMSHKSEADLERLYLLTREGFTKSALADYRDRKEATSRYMFAAVILGSDPVLSAIRREIQRVSEVRVEPDVIEKMLREDVLKRDCIEGPEAEAAMRRVGRSAEKPIRERREKPEPAPIEPSPGEPLATPPAQ